MKTSLPLTETVPAEVRAEMARQQVSVIALAKAAGVTPMYLSRRLSGQVVFDVADLDRMASALGVPVSTFLPVAAASPS